jgi:hypothetical protein
MGWTDARLLSRRLLSRDIGAVTRHRHPGPMSRPAMSEAKLHARAVQAARRMIARGERPGYRLLLGGDGRWRVDGLPGLAVSALDRQAASVSIRSTIATELEVDPMAFDIDP